MLVEQGDRHLEGCRARHRVPLVGRDLEDELRTIEDLGFESRFGEVDHLLLGAGVERRDVAAANAEVALKPDS